jgi:hypothetical protein
MRKLGVSKSKDRAPDYCFTVDGRRMLYDVKRISFCPSRYWPTVAVASSRGGPLEYRASSVRAEYEAAAAATATGPEPTAPRGRLRRGHPQRTQPCLHPLPERLPAPAQRRSAK